MTNHQKKDGPIIHVELYLKQHATASFIGRQGKNVQSLEKQTGVLSIQLGDRKRVNKYGWRPFTISGSTKAVATAKTVIRDLYAPYLMKKKIVWIPKAKVSEFGPDGRHAVMFQHEFGGIDYFGTNDEEHEGIRGFCPVRIEGHVDAVEQAVARVISCHGGLLKVPPPSCTVTRTSKAKNKSMDAWSEAELDEADSEKDEDPNKPTKEASLHHAGSSSGNMDDVPSTPETTRSPSTTVCPPLSAISLKSVTSAMSEIIQEGANNKPSPLSSLSEISIQVPDETPATVTLVKKPTATATATATDNCNTTIVLVDFLNQHQTSFKCSVPIFHQWLTSVDIETVGDFAEALSDDEFVQEKMKLNGLKVFKQTALARAALVVQVEATTTTITTATTHTGTAHTETETETTTTTMAVMKQEGNCNVSSDCPFSTEHTTGTCSSMMMAEMEPPAGTCSYDCAFLTGSKHMHHMHQHMQQSKSQSSSSSSSMLHRITDANNKAKAIEIGFHRAPGESLLPLLCPIVDDDDDHPQYLAN